MFKNVLIIDHCATPRREAIAEFLDRDTSDFGIFTAIDYYSGLNVLVRQGADSFSHIFLCADLPNSSVLTIVQFLTNHVETMPLINLYGEQADMIHLVGTMLAEHKPLVLDDISPLIERVEPEFIFDGTINHDIIVEAVCEDGEYFRINISSHVAHHGASSNRDELTGSLIADTNAAWVCLGEKISFFSLLDNTTIKSATPVSSLKRYRIEQVHNQ